MAGLGSELEIVNGPFSGLGNIGQTTGWDFAQSVLGIGVFLLAAYGLGTYATEKGWF